MEKTVIGLVAAMGAAVPFAGAQAAVVSSEDAASALRAASVGDLLDPVPNSLAILARLDAERTEPAPAAKGEQLAWHHHHHHWHHHHWHHHHHHWYHHHHHHHHYYYHHHHHHHYWRDGCWETPLGWVCP